MKFLVAVSLIAVVSSCIDAKRFPPSPRIVNGTEVADNAYPFQVSLQRNGRHSCGGSIITSNYVVTAAHCLETNHSGTFLPDPASDFSVRVGSDYHANGGHVVPITDIIRHPAYNRSNLHTDIALLRLATPLAFSESVKPIPVATAPTPPGAEVTVMGWGRIKYGGQNPPRMLETKMYAMSNDACRAITRQPTNGILCLERKGITGACGGDSGGAAIYGNNLVGVNSFRIRVSCSTTDPDMFANVPIFTDWLRQNSDLE